MQTNVKNDYTRGSISVHFIRLMIPLILGNILQQLYNAVDSVVISRYASDLEFASVGIAASVMNLYLFAIVGACTGLSILLAQAFGANDLNTFSKYHGQATIYGSLLVVCFSAITLLLLPMILTLLKTPDQLMEFVLSYLRIIIAGLLISYLYNFYASLLRSIGKAKIALFALLFAVILNLGLDLVFIAMWGMGIRGAALATMIAQTFSVLFCMIYLIKKDRGLFFTKKDCAWNPVLAEKMVHISLVTAIHQVSLYMGKVVIQSFINNAGTEMIMAYTATTRIESFVNSFGDSGSAVTSVIVAQNYGANKEERISQTFNRSFLILAILGLVSSAILYLTAPVTASFMLSTTTVAYSSAVSYLKIIAVFYVFCFTGNTFAGYFEGIGRVKIPFIGALSHMSLRVILSYFWIGRTGLNGVAIATGIGWILVNMGWGLCMKKRPRNEAFFKEYIGNN